MTDELLTIDDIAALCRCSRRHARDVIVKMPGFPELAIGSTQRRPLWVRKEVRGFMHSTHSVTEKERQSLAVKRSRFASEFADFSEAIRGAKRRAARKGRDYSLTREDVLLLWTRCKGACEVTGIPFDFTRLSNQKSRPFSPSVDRIDNSKGYTKDNVRVVCAAVNIAMNQWGDEVLYKIAEGIAKKGKP